MKHISALIEKQVPCVLNQVVKHLNGRVVLTKEVIEEGGIKHHFWAVPGGTTIHLKQDGLKFTEWEEIQQPLGIAVAQYLLLHKAAA